MKSSRKKIMVILSNGSSTFYYINNKNYNKVTYLKYDFLNTNFNKKSKVKHGLGSNRRAKTKYL